MRLIGVKLIKEVRIRSNDLHLWQAWWRWDWDDGVRAQVAGTRVVQHGKFFNTK